MPPLGIHFTTDQPTDPISDIGMVRLWDDGVTWKDIHVGPGQFHWGRLDWLVRDRYAGKNITLCIAATPQWSAEKPNEPHFAPWLGPGTNSLPRDTDRCWKPFIWELSTRFKGLIHSYEIWNEPQLVDFLGSSFWDDPGRRRLAKMIKDAARIIKGNDPKALIGSPSILPRESSGGLKRGGRMLDALVAEGAHKSIDWWACHLYPEPNKGAKRWNKYFKEFKDELKRRNLPNYKKVRVTETMFGLLAPDPIPEQKAYELVRDMYKYAGNSWVYNYAFDRMDLNGDPGSESGFRFDHNTAAWRAAKKYHNAF